MEWGDGMDMAEDILLGLSQLSDEGKQSALDYIEFLREREARQVRKMMEDIIEENLVAFQELAK